MALISLGRDEDDILLHFYSPRRIWPISVRNRGVCLFCFVFRFSFQLIFLMEDESRLILVTLGNGHVMPMTQEELSDFSDPDTLAEFFN